MENEIEITNSSNGEQEAEVVSNVEEGQTETTEPTETVEALKVKNQELYEQLQKAKGKVRGDDGKWVQKPTFIAQKAPVTESKPVTMSTKDYIALMNAKINEDDVVEVEDYAKYKGISIADALKLGVVKTLLAEKEEMRKTAQATNTSNARRSSVQISSDTLLAKAKDGDVSEDAEALVRARFEKKKK